MSEKTPIKPKVKHPGFCSTVLFFLFKTVLINALAWIVLILWFMSDYFVKGPQMTLQNAQAILRTNTQFIEQSPSSFAHYLDRWLHQVHQGFESLLEPFESLRKQLVI